MGFFAINRKMLPMKLHYGLYNAGASIQIIMPTYTKVFGFSSYVVGVIYTILPLTALFIKPVFGALADKFKWHKGVMMLWVFLTLMGFGCTWFIPATDRPTLNNSVSWALHENATWWACGESVPYLTASHRNCSLSCPLTTKSCQEWGIPELQFLCLPGANESLGKLTCKELSDTSEINGSTLIEAGCVPDCARSDGEDEGISDAKTFTSWKFWLFVVLLILGWGGISVSSTMADTICVETCGAYYGQQRLWGSISWGLFSLVAGLLIDAVSEEGQEKNYLPAFIIIVPPMILDLIVCYNMKVSIPQKSENIVRDAIKILLVPRNLLFSLWCIMVGANFGLMWNFCFWLLEDLAEEQGLTPQIKTIEGLSAAIETFIGETPAFFFGGWIVSKLGHGHSITLVFSIIGVRFIIYSVLSNPWYFLPAEVLQNSYGIFYSTMTPFAKEISTPGTEATIQTILCGLCEGVGVAIGSYVGGLLFNTYGGNMAFRIFGIAFIILAVTNEVIEFIDRMYFGKRQRAMEDILPTGSKAEVLPGTLHLKSKH